MCYPFPREVFNSGIGVKIKFVIQVTSVSIEFIDGVGQ